MENSLLLQSIELLQKANLEQAIEMLLEMQLSSGHRRVAIAISRQYHRLKLDRLKGLLPVQDQQLLECQITDRLVDLHEILLKAECAKNQGETVRNSDDLTARGLMESYRFSFPLTMKKMAQAKKWAFVMVDLIMISAGILLAKNAEVKSESGATILQSKALSSRSSFQGIVVDSLGRPVQGIKTVLWSGCATNAHTAKDGAFHLDVDLEYAAVNDTVELHHNQICIYRQAIRFPGSDTFVIPDIPASPPASATLVLDACSRVNGRTKARIAQTGQIYCIADVTDPNGIVVGIPNIRVAVLRAGCQRPIAETWTDAKGNYELKIKRGALPPDHILVEDSTGTFKSATTPFMPNRPNFSYELQKNDK